MSFRFRTVIDKERCKGCLLCVEACVRKALSVSKQLNEHGHRFVVSKDKGSCDGCGRCSTMCPDGAISIERETINDEGATSDPPVTSSNKPVDSVEKTSVCHPG